MPHLSIRCTAVAIAIAGTVAASTATLSAMAAGATPQPRAAPASAATVDADFSASLRPGAVVTVDRQCAHGGWFTEYQAYRSNGDALGPQHRSRDGLLVSWAGRHGRVTFDGVTFRNLTHARTRVAGWCS
jgi:hypothetical protein